PNEVARFTAALLQALRGHCGTQSQHGPGFGVGLSDLREATSAFLKWSQQAGSGERQKLGQTEGEGDWAVPLHVQGARPQVLIEMDIHPEGYRPVARVFMEDARRERDWRLLVDGPVRFIRAQG